MRITWARKKYRRREPPRRAVVRKLVVRTRVSNAADAALPPRETSERTSPTLFHFFLSSQPTIAPVDRTVHCCTAYVPTSSLKTNCFPIFFAAASTSAERNEKPRNSGIIFASNALRVCEYFFTMFINRTRKIYFFNVLYVFWDASANPSKISCNFIENPYFLFSRTPWIASETLHRVGKKSISFRKFRVRAYSRRIETEGAIFAISLFPFERVSCLLSFVLSMKNDDNWR